MHCPNSKGPKPQSHKRQSWKLSQIKPVKLTKLPFPVSLLFQSFSCARDLMSILIITVASESSFSIGKKILTPYWSGNTGYMTLKLDMSKTYDKVERLYMEKLMGKMGFAEAWVKLMMMCIFTTTYSVLINGEPQGHITLTRGLRQGDPLFDIYFCFVRRSFMGC